MHPTAIPQISVLMCVHNGADFLNEAIDSVLTQTFQDFEFVIVDDASTDASPSLIEAAAKRDARIRVVRLDENVGLTKALNIGLTEARGRYVARLDADDRCLPRRLEVQHAFLEAHGDHLAVACAHRVIDERGRTLRIHDEALDDWQIRWLSGFNPAAPHPAYLFRRTGFDGERLMYDPDYRTAQDFALWSSVADQGKIAVIRDVLLDYRRHGGAITVRKRKEQAVSCRKTGTANLRKRLPVDVVDALEPFLEVFSYNRSADTSTIQAAVKGFDLMLAHDLPRAPSKMHRRWLRRTAAGLLADCLLSRGAALHSPRRTATFLSSARRYLPSLVWAVFLSPGVAMKSLMATNKIETDAAR